MRQLREVGFTALQLKDAGISVRELREGNSSLLQTPRRRRLTCPLTMACARLLRATAGRFNSSDLFAIGVSAEDLR